MFAEFYEEFMKEALATGIDASAASLVLPPKNLEFEIRHTVAGASNKEFCLGRCVLFGVFHNISSAFNVNFSDGTAYHKSLYKL